MNEFWIDFSWFDNLLHFCNNLVGCSSHVSVKVSCGFVKVQVSACVSFLGLNQGKITKNGFFLNVFLSFELAQVFRLRINLDLSFSVDQLPFVFDRESTLLDQSSNSSRSVERRDASTTRSDFLSKGSLRSDFEFEFSFKILSFELGIFTNIG